MTADLPAVLVLYNVPRSAASGSPSSLESDSGVLVELGALTATLASLGVPHRVQGVARLEDIPPVLAAAPEHVVFNLVESLHVNPHHASYVPALCRAFGKACTGSPTDCLELTLDKARAKAVLAGAGLPVPAGLIVRPGETLSPSKLPPGPWIVKPLRTDASEGIHAQGSLFAEAGPALDSAVHNIHRTFDQSALVETLVGAREVNVSVIQRAGSVEILPIAEIDFSAFEPGRPRIVDYAAKWDESSFEYRNTPRVIPAPLDKHLAQEIRRLAHAAWDAVGCLDYARVDFRLTGDLRPVILEVNANPDISPDAGFAAAVSAASLSYSDFVRSVLTNASSRVTVAAAKPRAKSVSKAMPPRIAWTVQADREPILKLFEATGFFYPSEIEVVRELLDDSLAHGPAGHYQSYTAHVDGKVAGWACFGPTPCSLGTYDVYWIAVDPAVQGRSVGKFLMAFVEDLIAAKGGRLVVLETAGRPLYEPTRQFYLRIGYTEAARIADFYAPNDDKVVYTKHLTAS